jgi:hypothetical protein
VIDVDKISKKGSIGVLVAALLLFVSIFLPWWGMKLTAPQYQEGLYIYVYPYKLEGQLDIINGLNHYIGMAEFSEESFSELSYLPYVVGSMAVMTAWIGLFRRRKFLLVWLFVFAFGGALGLYDIYRWLKKYGTELDPHAPIQIDPFVPPVLGTNKLANFTTLSFFSYGAFLAALAFLILILVYWRGKER